MPSVVYYSYTIRILRNDFDAAVAYCLGQTDLVLKDEQREAVNYIHMKGKTCFCGSLQAIASHCATNFCPLLTKLIPKPSRRSGNKIRVMSKQCACPHTLSVHSQYFHAFELQ